MNTSEEFQKIINIEIDENCKTMLDELENSSGTLNDDQMSNLAEDLKNVSLGTLVGAFGLPRSMLDPGEYHPPSKVYEDAESDYHGGNDLYTEKSKLFKEQAKAGDLKDIYNPDRDLPPSMYQVNKDGGTKEVQGFHTEHIVPAKQIHEDFRGKVALSHEDRTNLANSDENLGATNPSLNQSKGARDLEEWTNKTSTADPEKDNAEAYDIDREETIRVGGKADQHVNDTLNEAFGEKVIGQGAGEAFKLGFRTAIGIVLVIFTKELFKEIKKYNSKKNLEGSKQLSLFETLKKSIKRIIKKIISKWGVIFDSFKSGSIAGFLSHIGNLVVNFIWEVARNTIRIIREGFNGLVQVIRLIKNHRKEMAKPELFKQIMLVIGGTISIVVGVLAEEVIAKFIELNIPFLAAYASTIGRIISGLCIGIGTILIIYAFDAIKNRINLTHKKTVEAVSGALVNKVHTIEMVKLTSFSSQLSLAMGVHVNESLKQITEDIVNTDEEIHEDLNEMENTMAELNKLLRSKS